MARSKRREHHDEVQGRTCAACDASIKGPFWPCQICGTYTDLAIILSGPNLSLKSTVAHYLRRALKIPAVESGYLPSAFNADGTLSELLRRKRRQFLTSIASHFAGLRLGLIIDAAFHSRSDRSVFYRDLLAVNTDIAIILLYVHCDDPEVREYRRVRRNSNALSTEKEAVSAEEVVLSLDRYEKPEAETQPDGREIPIIEVDTARMLVRPYGRAAPADEGHIINRLIASVREALYTGSL